MRHGTCNMSSLQLKKNILPQQNMPPKIRNTIFMRYRRQSVLKHCTKQTLSAHYIITAQLFHYTTSTLHHITTTPLHHYTSSPQHRYTITPQHNYTTAPHHHTTTTPHHHCTTTPLNHCTTAPEPSLLVILTPSCPGHRLTQSDIWSHSVILASSIEN